jgi:probable HAF family extracellular repeat protein
MVHMISKLQFAAIFAMVACSNGAVPLPVSTVANGNSASTHVNRSAYWPHYSVIDLGTLDGTYVSPGDINEAGAVSGIATTSSYVTQGFLWRKGQIAGLKTWGGPNSFAWALNDHAAVSGWAETAKRDPNGEDWGFGTNLIVLPTVWSDGHMVALPLLGGNNGLATGINDLGQSGGAAETAKADRTCTPPQVLAIKPVIWRHGRVQAQLPTWRGDSIGGVIDINDRGWAIGASGFCGNGPSEIPFNLRHGLLWHDGRMINLGTLGGSTGQEPSQINDRNQIVGQSDLAGDKAYHGFLWERGKLTDLGALPGHCCSIANDIGSDGLITGLSCKSPGGRLVRRGAGARNCRGVLWKDRAIIDANELISGHSPLFITIINGGPNASGQIVGTALVKKTHALHGFLATPCDDLSVQLFAPCE